MGAGIGVLEAVATQCTLRCGATLAAIYGTIGGIVDWRIKGRTVIYGAPDAPGRQSSLRVIQRSTRIARQSRLPCDSND